VLTRAQALQNRAFLKVLRKTGNVRLACREAGLKYATMQNRRAKHPGFALRWDAALAFAWPRIRSGAQSRIKSGTSVEEGKGGFRTVGGEPVVVRLKNGKLQMRRAQPGKLTIEAEQAFLAALSATCNIRLAAAAVGAAAHAFYRRRKKSSAFAREQRLALQRGYEALEMALYEGGMAGSHEHDDWRHNDPPAMPPMSVNQALQLMYLHQKAALLVDEPTPIRRRKGESNAARNERLALMAEARDERAREAFEVAEAERMERGLPAWGPAGQAVRLGLNPSAMLPDLAQITGWSNADPEKAPADPERALFGGWRMEHMEAELEYREMEKFENTAGPQAAPDSIRGKGPRVRRL